MVGLTESHWISYNSMGVVEDRDSAGGVTYLVIGMWVGHMTSRIMSDLPHFFIVIKSLISAVQYSF